MIETPAKIIEATEEADGHDDNDGDGQPIIMPGAPGSQSSLVEGFERVCYFGDKFGWYCSFRKMLLK